MLKYAKNDVQDGMKLVKVGLSNIISGLLDGTISHYTLEFPFEKDVLAALIHYARPDIAIFTEYRGERENLSLRLSKLRITVTYDKEGKYEFQLEQ